jgi:ATP-binding cassette subfamily F protein uup
VYLGTKVQVAYFDQFRSQLDEQATLIDVISPGSDFVEIGNQRKHVISYLGDFLFAPQRARSLVSSLSGGERNRCCWRACSRARRTCWCSTSRPTTSTSRRSNCSRSCCRITAVRCFWSATTAPSSTTW